MNKISKACNDYIMKIFIGADHRGYELKEKLKKWLADSGHEVVDQGAYTLDPKDDYTKFASNVAMQVAKDQNARGILACGSGVGVDVTANKFDGVRASIGSSPEQIELGRRDDDMNVLVIAAGFTTEGKAKDIVKKFLETEFSGEERHKRRLDDIAKIEETN